MMKMGMRLVTGFFTIVPLLSILSFSATVTIDETLEYQTIVGFGGFGAKREWYHKEPTYYDADFVDRVMNDLGVTVLRGRIPTDFELQNDNNDPDSINFSGYNVNVDHSGDPSPHPWSGHQAPLRYHIDYMKAMKAAGLETFITSIWSPAPWMKTNGSAKDGGELLPKYYEEFAEYCVAYLRIMEQNGLNIYAISLQNEPAFEQEYSSCVYSALQLRDAIKVVGARFEAEGIATRIFWPEHMVDWGRNRPYILAVLTDPEAQQYADIVAVHGYLDGVTPDSPDANNWRIVYDAGAKYGKPLWMTETSGFPNDWNGAFDLAQKIFVALKYGKVSVWSWWWLSVREPTAIHEGLLFDGVPTSRYYVSKNYYRYIRPGAVQIESSCGDNDVLVTAFGHSTDKTLTLVLINKGSATAVTVQGSYLPSEFNIYRSSSGEMCVDKGSVLSGSPIQLPARSVTTLYGTGYDPPSFVRYGPGEKKMQTIYPRGDYRVEIYGLDGRLAGTIGSAAGSDPNATGLSRIDNRPSGVSSGVYYSVISGSQGKFRAPPRASVIF